MPTAQEIYDLLIVDPDFAFQGKKAVMTEAKQRERQHRNNQAALSMAWEDSPTLKSLIEFLNKADDKKTKPALPNKLIFHGPLRGILQAIAVHKQNSMELPWAGPDRIGTLQSLIAPHINSLKTVGLTDEALDLSPETDQYKHRQRLNQEILDVDTELQNYASGDYNPSVLDTLLLEYAGLEQDVRAIGNEIGDKHGGKRLLQLGNSYITHNQPTPHPQNRYNALGNWFHEANDRRLEVLNEIEGYLPSFTDLPSPKEQLSKLSADQKKAGMYGNMHIKPNVPTNDSNWLNLNVSDDNSVQNALNGGLVSYDNAQNSKSEIRANERAVKHFLVQNKNQLPINRAFDPLRSAKDVFTESVRHSTASSFNNFMRLTFWHPNKAIGAQNLGDILQKVVKKSESDTPNTGYYKLGEDTVDAFRNMSPNSMTDLIYILLNSPSPMTLLNPDDKGNSGINGLIHKYSNLDTEIKEASIKGLHSSGAFNMYQTPAHPSLEERRREIPDALKPSAPDSILSRVLDNLAVVMDRDNFNPDEAKALILETLQKSPHTLYSGQYPFASVGTPLADAKGESRNIYGTLMDATQKKIFDEETGTFIPHVTKFGRPVMAKGMRQINAEINSKVSNIHRHIRSIRAVEEEEGPLKPIRERTYLLGHHFEGGKKVANVPGYEDVLNAESTDPTVTEEEAIENLMRNVSIALQPTLEQNAAQRAEYEANLAEYTENLPESVREEQDRVRPFISYTARAVPNEQYTTEMNALRAVAEKLLRDRNVLGPDQLVTEEDIDDLLRNPNFKNEYADMYPEKYRDQEERPSKYERDVMERAGGIAPQPPDEIPIPDDIQADMDEANEYKQKLENKLQAVVDNHIKMLTTTIDDVEKAGETEKRQIARTPFISQRLDDLYEIVDYMDEHSVIASEASRLLNIPLTPKEQMFLNRGDLKNDIIRRPSDNALSQAKPIISTGMISGDIVSLIKGEPIDNLLEKLSLNLSFDPEIKLGSLDEGEAYGEYIKRIVNNHPSFQELVQMLEALDVDFNFLHSSLDTEHGEHRLDMYNKVRTERSLIPFLLEKGEAVVNPSQGPLQENPDGTWTYSGTLFKDMHKLLGFVNNIRLDSLLESMTAVDSQSMQGDVVIPLIVHRDVEGIYPQSILEEAHKAQAQNFDAGPTFIDDYIDKYYPEDKIPNTKELTPNPEELAAHPFLYIQRAQKDAPHYVTQDGTEVPVIGEEGNKLWQIERDDENKVTKTGTFLGKITGRTRRKEFGLGEAAQAPEGEVPPVYEYLKNIFDVIAQNEANPEVFAKRRRKQAEQIQNNLQDQLQRDNRAIGSVSGLPPETLELFTDLMYKYREYGLEAAISEEKGHNKGIYDFQVPDELRPWIAEHLPIFVAEPGGHTQAHIDTFLTNFYRQFDRRFTQGYNRVYDSIKNDPTQMRDVPNVGPGINSKVTELIEEARKRNKTLPDDDPRKSKFTGENTVWERNMRAYLERALVQERADDRFEALRETDVAGNNGLIDLMLSESDGRPRTGVDDTNSVIPRGGTHIPISVNGILQQVDIPSIPFTHQFPKERFPAGTGRGSTITDTGTSSMPVQVPTAWLWFHEQGPILEALADGKGFTMEELLSEMMNEAGSINVTRIGEWLKKYGFVGNANQDRRLYYHDPEIVTSEGDRTVPATKVTTFREGSEYDSPNTLPSIIVPNPTLTIANKDALNGGVPANHNWTVNEYAALIRSRIAALEEERRAKARGSRFYRRRNVDHVHDPENFPLETMEEVDMGEQMDYSEIPSALDQRTRIFKAGQDPEIQELLSAIYGKPKPPGIEHRVRYRLNMEGQVMGPEESSLLAEFIIGNLVMPGVLEDEKGDLYWDISGRALQGKYNEETGGWEVADLDEDSEISFISEFYTRLRAITDHFVIENYGVWKDDDNVETMAEGQPKAFIYTDDDGTSIRIEMPSPRQYMTASERGLPEGKVDPLYMHRINPLTGQLEEVTEYEFRDMAGQFQLADTFTKLQEKFVDVAGAMGIELPSMLVRSPLGTSVYDGDMVATLNSLAQNPLDSTEEARQTNPVVPNRNLQSFFPDEYFDKEELFAGLRPPTSEKDVALQHSGLTNYLASLEAPKTMEEWEERRSMQSYINSLKEIMTSFELIDINDADKFELQSEGRRYAESIGILEDGKFKLYDDTGKPNLLTYNFLNKSIMQIRKQPAHANEVIISDTLLKNAGLLRPETPDVNMHIQMSESVRNLLRTLAEVGKQHPEETNSEILRSLVKPREPGEPLEINTNNVYNLLNEYITESRTRLPQLLVGKLYKDSSKNQLGILTWLYAQWDNYFKALGILKPEDFRQQSSLTWQKLDTINDYIRKHSIIEETGTGGIVDVGGTEARPDTPETQEEMTQNKFNNEWSDLLRTLRDGGPEETSVGNAISLLNELTHPAPYRYDRNNQPILETSWNLDENDFALLDEALRNGNYPEEDRKQIHSGLQGFKDFTPGRIAELMAEPPVPEYLETGGVSTEPDDLADVTPGMQEEPTSVVGEAPLTEEEKVLGRRGSKVQAERDAQLKASERRNIKVEGMGIAPQLVPKGSTDPAHAHWILPAGAKNPNDTFGRENEMIPHLPHPETGAWTPLDQMPPIEETE